MAERRRDRFDLAFDRLCEQLASPGDRLAPSQGQGVLLFLHALSDTVEVHRRVPRWAKELARRGWRVEVVSLRKLLWERIDDSGFWADWVEEAGPLDEERAGSKAVRSALGKENSGEGLLVAAMRDVVSREEEKRLVVFTDALCLHPWFRAATLPNLLEPHLRGPAVLLFPGKRSERGSLSFLGFHTPEVEYRATDIEVADADGP